MTISKRVLNALALALAPLLFPLIGMFVSSDVNWSAFDFIVGALLLVFTGLAIEFITRKIKQKSRRLLLVAGVLFILLLVWIELAVGLFGSPLAGS